MMTICSAQLAIEDFGPQVLGRPIELLTADDQNKADVDTVIARKWLDDDNAVAIISNSFSPLGRKRQPSRNTTSLKPKTRFALKTPGSRSRRVHARLYEKRRGALNRM
jgi:regulator of protease activity HflC (stomatin/prohibitin superfamily)